MKAKIENNELKVHFNEYETLRIEQAVDPHREGMAKRLNDQILANILKEAWEVKE